MQALRDQAAALQEVTKYDGDLTNAAQASLAAFDLTGQQIQAVTPLMLDLATAMGTDAAGAAQTIGRALLGNTRGLKAIGIEFTATGDRARDLATLMDLISQKFGGFAEREGKTAAGQAAQLANSFGDLQESIGAALLPALQQLVNIAKPLLDIVKNLPTPLVSAGLAFGGIAVATRLLGGNMSTLSRAFTGIRGAVTGLPTVVSSLGTAWQYAGQAAQKASGPTATLGQRMTEMGKIAIPGLQSKLGGLIGFLGGPWGIAMVAATVVLGNFAIAQSEASAAVSDFRTTLESSTGATTAATIAKVSESIRNAFTDEDIARMQKYGIDVGEVSRLIAAGKTAEANAIIQAGRAAAQAAGDDDAYRLSTQLLFDVLPPLAKALSDAQAAQRDAANAAADAGTTVDGLKGSVDDLTGAYEGLSEAALAAQAAIGGSDEENRGRAQDYADPNTPMDDTERQYWEDRNDRIAARRAAARAEREQAARDAEAARKQAAEDAKRAREQAAADAAAELEQLKANAQAMADAVRDSARGSITEMPNASITAMTAGLKIRLSQIKPFAGDLEELAKRGMPDWLLQQIVDSGIPDGAQVAATLANSNGKEFRAFSRAAQRVDAAAGVLGNRQAQRVYGYAPGSTTMPAAGAVNVSVYIGNEEFNGHIDTRIGNSDAARAQRGRAGRRYAS